MNCWYCSRPGARPLREPVTLHDASQDLTRALRPILCPTCEVFIFPEVAAYDDPDEGFDLEDDIRRLQALGRCWVSDELERIYSEDARPDGCWWCGAPGRLLGHSERDGQRITLENPTLCFACQGLLLIVPGSFANQDEAQRQARAEAEERLLAAANGG